MAPISTASFSIQELLYTAAGGLTVIGLKPVQVVGRHLDYLFTRVSDLGIVP